MTAVAVAPPTPTPSAVGCTRSACRARGVACRACIGGGEQHAALTDGQVGFILRTKLAAACVEGEAFEAAWRAATAEIIARSANGQARSWRVALESVREEYREAYRRKRTRLWGA
jgi:hypothetical protein